MLPVVYSLLLLSQDIFGARAAPASTNPTSLSLNAIISSNITTIPSLFDQQDLASLALLLNSSYEERVVLYRVPDTHTLLRIALQDPAITKLSLGQTILRTQQSLSSFIRTHDAEDKPLALKDDPYESDARYPGCFFGVTTFPVESHHLTYGIVMNVLQGLWLYLYREGRFLTAMFEVRDDQFGCVGIGKLTSERPEGVLVMGGNGSVGGRVG